MKENKEFPYEGKVYNGFVMLALFFILLTVITVATVGMFIYLPIELYWIPACLIAVSIIGIIIFLCGFFIIQPNQARVMIFFGEYRGTYTKVGYHWNNPFVSTNKVSLRIRNLDISPIKVNDRMGNPVMIGMVLVWKVSDTYRAIFDIEAGAGEGVLEVDDKKTKALNAFVAIQSDAALREVTGQYAYDEEGRKDELTLRSGGAEINDELEKKLNERLAMAGIEVVEARLNYLAYAPEIAAVMLRRQQAAAIISAREKIVEGAVSMVKMALDKLKDNPEIQLDTERKAAMVSNLLVVLCSDEPAQPVINAGTVSQ